MVALLPMIGRADRTVQAQPLPALTSANVPEDVSGLQASPTAQLPVVETQQVQHETNQEVFVEEQKPRLLKSNLSQSPLNRLSPQQILTCSSSPQDW